MKELLTYLAEVIVGSAALLAAYALLQENPSPTREEGMQAR